METSPSWWGSPEWKWLVKGYISYCHLFLPSDGASWPCQNKNHITDSPSSSCFFILLYWYLKSVYPFVFSRDFFGKYSNIKMKCNGNWVLFFFLYFLFYKKKVQTCCESLQTPWPPHIYETPATESPHLACKHTGLCINQATPCRDLFGSLTHAHLVFWMHSFDGLSRWHCLLCVVTDFTPTWVMKHSSLTTL